MSVDVPGAMKSRLFSRPPESGDEQGEREGEVPHPLDSMAEEALMGAEAGVVPLLLEFCGIAFCFACTTSSTGKCERVHNIVRIDGAMPLYIAHEVDVEIVADRSFGTRRWSRSASLAIGSIWRSVIFLEDWPHPRTGIPP